MNPVYVIDRLPDYINSTNNQNSKKYQYILLYVQTGFISDTKIRE